MSSIPIESSYSISIQFEIAYSDLLLIAFVIAPGIFAALGGVLFALANMVKGVRFFAPWRILVFSGIVAAIDVMLAMLGDAVPPLVSWYTSKSEGGLFLLAALRLALEMLCAAAIMWKWPRAAPK